MSYKHTSSHRCARCHHVLNSAIRSTTMLSHLPCRQAHPISPQVKDPKTLNPSSRHDMSGTPLRAPRSRFFFSACCSQLYHLPRKHGRA